MSHQAAPLLPAGSGSLLHRLMLPAGREAAMVLILVVSRTHDSSLRVVDESRTRMGYIAPTTGANVVLHFHAWGAPVHQTQHTPPPHTATTHHLASPRVQPRITGCCFASAPRRS